MGQETTKAQHPAHLKAAVAACTSVAEVDLVKATLAPGGINSVMFDNFGHYFQKDLMRAINDKRVALGGASADGGAW
jgi:hypothetical protein